MFLAEREIQMVFRRNETRSRAPITEGDVVTEMARRSDFKNDAELSRAMQAVYGRTDEAFLEQARVLGRAKRRLWFSKQS
jgi:hypothetical protein